LATRLAGRAAGCRTGGGATAIRPGPGRPRLGGGVRLGRRGLRAQETAEEVGLPGALLFLGRFPVALAGLGSRTAWISSRGRRRGLTRAARAARPPLLHRAFRIAS
jgi:hypothetical protein